jgi:putative metallohydrolase (TIGR04338 family)
MVRDAQRKRVCDAEVCVPRGREWRSIPEVQAYVDRVLASGWWRRSLRSVTRVTIEPARWNAQGSRAFRGPTGGTIRLHPWHYSQLFLFHELAHLAQPLESAFHGPEFCEIYLRMVFCWMWEGSGAGLEYGFKTQRVHVAPSAVPLRRMCPRRHVVARQPSGVIWWQRRVPRPQADRDTPITANQWLVPRSPRRMAAEPHVISIRCPGAVATPPPSPPTGVSAGVETAAQPWRIVQQDLRCMELFGRAARMRPITDCGGDVDEARISLDAFLAAYFS